MFRVIGFRVQGLAGAMSRYTFHEQVDHAGYGTKDKMLDMPHGL